MQVGVGLLDNRRHGIVFTSRDHDFRKGAVSALNISLAAVREPVLVVTKKNKAVLERLAGGDLSEVVLVRRPPLPDGVETVATVEEALAWVRRRVTARA